ncbi:GFA family protein [Baekduia soli]|uniref:GFA family protein n=1 Tax=Baekduia soli TaxID=496014 RepID=A0A5B8U9S1_9ACTN|nr:GFA family protein [Baekduia soli]QEC49412.1 GFA family protein [Baekduia soli]
MTTTAVLTGACGCGAVTFELSEPLGDAMYCHCTRCQRRSGGSTGAAAWAQPGSFRITSGEQELRRWAPPGGMVKVFCGICGSGLWAEMADDPAKVAIRLGAVDGDPGVRPSARIFAADAAPWEPIPDDGLPRYDGFPG